MRRKYESCQPWKEKGEYPVDEEGVLFVSPYWSRALALAEKRRNKKFYFADLVIICSVFYLMYLVYNTLRVVNS